LEINKTMRENLTLEKKFDPQNQIVELFPAASAVRAGSREWTSDAAREISEYLLTGWHHSTETGRAAIAAIIENHFNARFGTDRD
jgi:hypothetical protein